MKDRPLRTRTTEAGFTLIELLVVIAIIALLAAVALPAIGRYIRVYQIQGATQQVAGEIQAARLKAIGRNVNMGVAFVVWGPNQFQWVMEDLPSTNPPASPPPCPSPGVTGSAWVAPLPLNECAALHGPVKTLPAGVEFDTAPPTGGAPNNCMFWFSRLGMYQSTRTTGPSPSPACAASYLVNNPGSALITVKQAATGLHSRVDISSGGRIQVIRSW